MITSGLAGGIAALLILLTGLLVKQDKEWLAGLSFIAACIWAYNI